MHSFLLRVLACCALAIAAGPTPASPAAPAASPTPQPALKHYEPVTRTGGNAVILVPRLAKIVLGGAALEAGDEIAVYTPKGVVAGAAVWTGSADLALTVWEDDVFTDRVDGFAAGDAFEFRVWDRSERKEWKALGATFAAVGAPLEASGHYMTNGIYLVSALESAATDAPEHGGGHGDHDGRDDEDDDRDDAPSPKDGAVGEMGRIEVTQARADAWQRVSFRRSYRDPVVVVSPVSYNGVDPAVTRVRNVTSRGFEVQVDEWDYLDGAHTAEVLFYLVVEAGAHEVPGLGTVQAGRGSLDGSSAKVPFHAAFDAAPLVFSQVASTGKSTKNARTAVVRHERVGRDGFEAYVQQQGAHSRAVRETVGWVALPKGTGALGSRTFEAALSGASVTDAWRSVSFGAGLGDQPFLLAAMQTAAGGDAAALRYRTLTRSGFDVRVEEEQSKDSETRHAPEHVAYFAVSGTDGAPFLIDASTTAAPPTAGGRALGEMGRIEVTQARADAWQRVSFRRSYRDPVVVVSPVSYNGVDPAVTRVRNVTSRGFEVQVDEWDYLDGAHTAEVLFYLVVEAGAHEVPGLGTVQAGRAPVDGDDTRIRFGTAFGGTPVVLAQVMAANHRAPATATRISSVGRGEFRAYVQHEGARGRAGEHVVAWIALPQGAGLVGDHAVEADVTPRTVAHDWHRLGFDTKRDRTPLFFAAMQSAHGGDAAALRYRDLRSGGVEVRVEEEQSRDAETVHADEKVGYVVFWAGGDAALLDVPASASATSESATLASMASRTLAPSSAEIQDVPLETALLGNYPNPFSNDTAIRYTLAASAHVRLEVYDLLGRRVEVLVDEARDEGAHEAILSGADLPSGVYVVRLVAGERAATKTITLTR